MTFKIRAVDAGENVTLVIVWVVTEAICHSPGTQGWKGKHGQPQSSRKGPRRTPGVERASEQALSLAAI